MVGSNTLGWMEFMTKHGMANASEPLGGIPVIVFLLCVTLQCTYPTKKLLRGYMGL